MKKETTTKKKPKKEVCHPLTEQQELERVMAALKGAGFTDFVRYLHSPRRILITNFFAGVVRGFGILVGMTIVMSMLIWFLSNIVDFPLIGEWFQGWLDLFQMMESQSNSINRIPSSPF